MLRNFIIILCMLPAIFARGVVPGVSAEKCFTEAPGDVLPLLDRSSRLDMLDYYHAGSTKTTVNTAEGGSFITHESDYSIKYQIADGLTGQIFVLNPMDKCPLIGIIETIALPVADSNVKFYNCRWEPVDVFTEPSLNRWFDSSDGEAFKRLEEELPFMLATMEYDPSEAEIVITNTTSGYYTPDDSPEELKCLRDKLVMRWSGKKFKLKQ